MKVILLLDEQIDGIYQFDEQAGSSSTRTCSCQTHTISKSCNGAMVHKKLQYVVELR